MTAAEAREITISKKKTLEELIKIIKIMAVAGKNFATVEFDLFVDHDKIIEYLIDNGYSYRIIDEYLSIKW